MTGFPGFGNVDDASIPIARISETTSAGDEGDQAPLGRGGHLPQSGARIRCIGALLLEPPEDWQLERRDMARYGRAERQGEDHEGPKQIGNAV